MYSSTEEFIGVFNEYYPFERYILTKPQKINYLFDDAFITEIFIPSTEIKPILADNGQFLCNTSIDKDEIYVKIKGPAGEMRFALTDFSDEIMNDIVGDIIHDFGESEYQDLYCESDDYESLKETLENQRRIITEKYGKCNIKPNFIITDTINLLNR